MESEKLRVPFPYPRARPVQARMMRDVAEALAARCFILCHAPTGVGKTAAALCPALALAEREGLEVFFLTPKIAQHEVALALVRALRKKFGAGHVAADLVGRRYLCLEPWVRDTETGFYEWCRKLRTEERCAFFGHAVGYTPQQRSVARLYLEPLKKAAAASGGLGHVELMARCSEVKGPQGARGLCPYEAATALARDADLVIADYYHLFHPGVRRVVLQRLGKRLKNALLIVDEAHNLPERVRALMGCALTTFSLERAAREAAQLGLQEEKQFLSSLRQVILKETKTRLGRGAGEVLFDPSRLRPLLGEEKAAGVWAEALKEAGVAYLEATRKGRSALVQVARFLERWNEPPQDAVRILRRGPGRGFSLHLCALDPAPLTRPLFEKARGGVLMSGTLLPTAMFADVLGLSGAVQRVYASPFPAKNRLGLVVPSATTRFQRRGAEEFENIARTCTAIARAVPGNTAFFFPSFELLDAVRPRLEASLPRVLAQRPSMDALARAALLKRFRRAGRGDGSVLLAVAGGMFGEGVDFIGEQLLCAVVVGVPLQRMTLEVACLVEHYEAKFGRGWHYGYLYPAMNRALQAAGRVIRDERDRGVTVFLDERYTWKNYAACFPPDLALASTREPARLIARFFSQKTVPATGASRPAARS